MIIVVETRRKKGETFESLLRRFNKRLQQSGKLLQAKKVRFHERPSNKRMVKESALRRKEIKKSKEYLKKIGKLKEDTYTTYKRS